MIKNVSQIKSKRRVADFGEVYTNEREVNCILDLIIDESYRIDSRFLEPAAGNGNFLVEILKRKLETVKRYYKKSQYEYEKYAFTAVSSIYGIDILQDNVIECRGRLYEVFNSSYVLMYKDYCRDRVKESIRYLLSRNIIWGDSLTGLTNDENPEPIIISEWSMIKSYVKRRDFALCDMLAYEELSIHKQQVIVPRREFDRINFMEVSALG